MVTGSMLHRTEYETESPVTTFSAEQIQQTGLTTIADVVRTISADNSGTLPTAFGIGFAAGAAGVALRGLTVNSTLVLIDGRRAAPYALADDGQRSFVDLNTIPLDAVERIEVLKDGASSIYGADAIAGVVNVILKKQYQGAEVNVEIGKGQHPGGGERRLTRASARAIWKPIDSTPMSISSFKAMIASSRATAHFHSTPPICLRSAVSIRGSARRERSAAPPAPSLLRGRTRPAPAYPRRPSSMPHRSAPTGL